MANVEESDRCCWLCLSSAPLEVTDLSKVNNHEHTCDERRGVILQELSLPCKCPYLWSHAVCLARWQLRKAGQEEESFCRFCKAELPHWAEALLRAPTQNDVNKARPVPMMTVTCRGRKAVLPCYPGKRGELLFQMLVRTVFQVDSSVRLHARFKFKESELLNGLPTDSEQPQHDAAASNLVYLDGIGAFDAACRVATELAERKQDVLRRKQTAESSIPMSGVCTSRNVAQVSITQESASPSNMSGEQSRRLAQIATIPAASQPEQVQPQILAMLNPLPQAGQDIQAQQPCSDHAASMSVRRVKRSWVPCWMAKLNCLSSHQPEEHP